MVARSAYAEMEVEHFERFLFAQPPSLFVLINDFSCHRWHSDCGGPLPGLDCQERVLRPAGLVFAAFGYNLVAARPGD